MTFSIAGHCPESGMFGVAIASSSICVAARCAFVEAGVGAAITQNVTDPRLGPQMLALARRGASAREVVDSVAGSAVHGAHRQLALVDGRGRNGHFSGARMLGQHAACPGRHCVAIGNLLASDTVPAAMVGAFTATRGSLPLRLLVALEAGLAAGGEAGPVHSAGLLVAHEVPWPVVDLRVDWDDAPIVRLRRLWREYEPQMDAYVIRALNPEQAPAYGVPGDP